MPKDQSYIEKRKYWTDLVFRILGFLAAVVAIIYMQCQIDSSKEQARDQIKSSEKQARAVWQSFRPAIDVHGIIPLKDIKTGDNRVRNVYGDVVSGDTYWTLHFTIENYGHSPARLTSLISELISEDHLGNKPENPALTSLVQQRTLARPFPMSFKKSDSLVFLSVSIDYGWEVKSDEPVSWNCTKWYEVWVEKGVWRVMIIPDSLYQIERDKIPEENRKFFD